MKKYVIGIIGLVVALFAAAIPAASAVSLTTHYYPTLYCFCHPEDAGFCGPITNAPPWYTSGTMVESQFPFCAAYDQPSYDTLTCYVYSWLPGCKIKGAFV